MSIYDVAARFFCDRLADSWVPGYLAGRGLGLDGLERWQVGYAPAARDALTRQLRRTGYSEQVILAAGLARQARNGGLADLFRDLPPDTSDFSLDDQEPFPQHEEGYSSQGFPSR